MKLRNRRVCRSCQRTHIFYCTLARTKDILCCREDIDNLPEKICSCGAPSNWTSDYRDVPRWACLYGSTKNLTSKEKTAFRKYLTKIERTWNVILQGGSP